jgi:hypothetical protein
LNLGRLNLSLDAAAGSSARTFDQAVRTLDQGAPPAAAPHGSAEPNGGSTIKKCERAIIPFSATTGKKNA